VRKGAKMSTSDDYKMSVEGEEGSRDGKNNFFSTRIYTRNYGRREKKLFSIQC
jgi:hypothetical protein